MKGFWLVVTVLGWLLITLLAGTWGVGTSAQLIAWMAVQQGWLVFGGLLGVQHYDIIRPRLAHMGRGVLDGVGLFLLNGVFGMISMGFFSLVYGADQVSRWLEHERTGVEMLMQWTDSHGIVPVFLLVCVGAPLSEELFFRGVMLTELRTVLPVKYALVVTALFFALVHFYLVQFLPVLVSGLVLGWLFVESGNLTRPLLAHMTVNFIVLMLELWM